jgi:hypothetical protein
MFLKDKLKITKLNRKVPPESYRRDLVIGAIPPPALSGSGSRVECFINIPLSLGLPGSPCVSYFLSITTVGYPVKQTESFLLG